MVHLSSSIEKNYLILPPKQKAGDQEALHVACCITFKRITCGSDMDVRENTKLSKWKFIT